MNCSACLLRAHHATTYGVINRQHTPPSLDASGNIRFENTKFDGTKLPLVVCASLNHNRWYKLPTFTNRNSASFQPQIAPIAPESRQEDAHVRC
jgi:hypothetical protein